MIFTNHRLHCAFILFIQSLMQFIRYFKYCTNNTHAPYYAFYMALDNCSAVTVSPSLESFPLKLTAGPLVVLKITS